MNGKNEKTLGQGMRGLGKGIVKGVTGVVTDPYKGAQSGGFQGFVKGVATGVVGVVSKPVQEVSEYLEKAPKYFSSPLEVQVQRIVRDEAPDIMVNCLTELQMRGMDKEGIFRVPGNHAKIREIRNLLEAGQKVSFCEIDIFDIACILKLWLRDLPEPLVPFRLYDWLMKLGKLLPQLRKDEDVKWKPELRAKVRKIKDPRRKYLGHLMCVLNKFAGKSEINKMTAKNLAIVICPNILYTNLQEDMASADIALRKRGEVEHAINVVTVLIEEYEFFFFTETSESKNDEEKGESYRSKECKSTGRLSSPRPFLALTEVQSLPSKFSRESQRRIAIQM